MATLRGGFTGAGYDIQSSNVEGVPVGISLRSLAKKLESLGYRTALFVVIPSLGV